MKTVNQLIRQARDLISDPEKWTQKASYRDKQGKSLDNSDDPSQRACFCVIGALQHCAGENRFQLVPYAVKRIKAVNNIESIINLNDDSTHEQVLKALDNCLT